MGIIALGARVWRGGGVRREMCTLLDLGHGKGEVSRADGFLT